MSENGNNFNETSADWKAPVCWTDIREKNREIKNKQEEQYERYVDVMSHLRLKLHAIITCVDLQVMASPLLEVWGDLQNGIPLHKAVKLGEGQMYTALPPYTSRGFEEVNCLHKISWGVWTAHGMTFTCFLWGKRNAHSCNHISKN